MIQLKSELSPRSTNPTVSQVRLSLAKSGFFSLVLPNSMDHLAASDLVFGPEGPLFTHGGAWPLTGSPSGTAASHLCERASQGRALSADRKEIATLVRGADTRVLAYGAGEAGELLLCEAGEARAKGNAKIRMLAPGTAVRAFSSSCSRCCNI